MITGNIRKMHVDTMQQQDGAFLATYQLPVGDEKIDMNAVLGQHVSVTHTGNIHCVHCGSKTKKSFNQGYCYRCLITLAQCDTCIIKPELCHYQAGTCREPEWGEAHCLTDHFVYLSNTGALKIGITRHVTDGVSSRWIDQGATQALPILRVSERLVSGLVEHAAKSHISDKTNWRTMLKGHPDDLDIQQRAQDVLDQISDAISEVTTTHGLTAVQPLDADPITIIYPVLTYPDKIKSINLDKTPEFSGVLQGIKEQYWMLDGDRVINMRKYAGYELTLKVE